VFTETDLRAAHVVARRIAAVLKNTMVAPESKRSGIEAAVTLATLKPTDSVDSLIARVVGDVCRGIERTPCFSARPRTCARFNGNESKVFP